MSLPSGVPSSLPGGIEDANLNRLLRGVQTEKDWGIVNQDPEGAENGHCWTRGDLSPPERRFRIAGTTYKVELTAV